MTRILVATACDAAHFDLVEDLLASLQAVRDRDVRIGFVQLGADEAPDALTGLADEVRRVDPDSAQPGPGEGYAVSRLAIKARLPDLFPGHDAYVWMDGDTWLQNPAAIRRIAGHAHVADLCIHPELDANYCAQPFPGDYAIEVYGRLFGQDVRDRYVRYPMVNCGVFGATARSPLWARWADILGQVRRRQEGSPAPFFSDQIPLHYLIYSGALSFYPLRAADNWLVVFSAPRISPEGRLTAPTFPHEEINVVHLAGTAKSQMYSLHGRSFRLRYREVRALAGL